MKSNMAEYRDTLNILDLSPPTLKLMKLKQIGTAEKLFHLPGSTGICAKPLIRQYQQRLTVVKDLEKREERNENIKNVLGLGEIVEEEFNYPEISAQDPAFVDDFEEVGAVDFENYENNHQVQLQDETELMPVMQAAMELTDDSFSPTDKKKKRERLMEEEEPAVDGDDDNRWSKRTQSVLNSIVNKINHSEEEEISLDDLLTKGSTRKTAAQKFYTLLVLKKWQAIELQQAEPYEEIFISTGPNVGQTLGQ
ncbi:unnamed protein product [Caenorhabditis angaria]|uniref:Rad21/Rec8-like protein C-terminal eukaryotic domain-containing protein n=1 Tax=Caenorhabditis angaria TaxID=860376 RepID=A0A9P1IXB2_9PELO|nr:unnamed protein product [Caenorhabditis angaria]